MTKSPFASKYLSQAARSPLGRRLTAWMLVHMSFAVPIQRLREGRDWLAFHHPAPSYPFHVLLVPRQPVAHLTDLDPTDGVRLSELLAMVQSLVAQFHLEESGYRLVVNGGTYQDFPQLHFHLISEQKPPVA